MLSLVSVLIFATYLAMGIAQVALTRSAAAGTADMAALAAAQNLEAACSVAQFVSNENNAKLVDCVVAGADVVVRVELPAPALFRAFADVPVRAESRAGPSE